MLDLRFQLTPNLFEIIKKKWRTNSGANKYTFKMIRYVYVMHALQYTYTYTDTRGLVK